MDNNKYAFLELVRAGLWEKKARLSQFGGIDYAAILQLAEEQAVVGLVTAGLEHVVDVKVPQEWLLQFVGETLQIEQRNKSLNSFIGVLVDKMRAENIYTLLVKGQGIAQCYERPLWRTSGDVDFYLSADNYNMAKDFLLPLSSDNKPERLYSKEMGLSIDTWSVEIHGTQRTGLSMRVDKVIDDVHSDIFYGGNVRSWQNGNTQVFMPSADNDVFIVFTHFIKHFYNERTTIRQLCDWCRLLWTYRDTLNHGLLESRIRKAGLMSEWCAFASLVVEYLGMPEEAMPLYKDNPKWGKKAKRLVHVIIINSDASKKMKYVFSIARIFPENTILFSPCIFFYINLLKIKEMIIRW